MFPEKQVTGFARSVFDIVDYHSDMGNWGKDIREMWDVLSKEDNPLQSSPFVGLV